MRVKLLKGPRQISQSSLLRKAEWRSESAQSHCAALAQQIAMVLWRSYSTLRVRSNLIQAPRGPSRVDAADQRELTPRRCDKQKTTPHREGFLDVNKLSHTDSITCPTTPQ